MKAQGPLRSFLGMCLPWFHVCASPPPPLSPVSPCTWLLLKVLISHESSLLLLKALDVLLYSFSYNPLTQASTVFLQLLCTTVPTTASRGLQLISKLCHHSRLCPQEGETDTSPPGPPPDKPESGKQVPLFSFCPKVCTSN